MKYLAFLSIVLLLAIPSFAYDVEMNLRYKIGNSDQIYSNGIQYSADSVFTEAGKKYIVSQGLGVSAGLVFAGEIFNSMSLKKYPGDYSISMKQSGDDNRFIIVFTNGTYQNIDDKYESVDRLLSTSFGYEIKKSVNYPLFLQIQYNTIDIINSAMWQGQKTIQVRNEGKNDRGITQVSVRAVK